MDSPQAPSLSLRIEGMSCGACAARLQQGLQGTPGVTEARVNFATAEATVCFRPAELGAEGLEAAVARLGYRGQVLEPPEDASQDLAWRASEAQAERGLRQRLLVGAACTLPLVALSMSGQAWLPHQGWWLLALATPVQFWVGWPFLRQAALGLRQGHGGMDLLVALGSLAAYGAAAWEAWRHPHHAHSFAEASASVLTLVLLGRWLEHRAKGEAQAAIRLLGDRLPPTAHRLEGGQEQAVPLARLRPGDRLRVLPGEHLPADGLLLEGHTHVDESLLTGEAQPLAKGPGSPLTAGTLNQEGAFTMAATQVGAASTLGQIARLVQAAQGSKSRAQALADRLSARFVPLVLALSTLSFLGWFLWGRPGDAAWALQVAVAVLVVACPCALGLATPMAILVGTGQGARRGVLLRGGEALEAAEGLTTVCFDKTGTLTEGKPKLLALHAPGERPWRPGQGPLPEAAASLLQAAGSLETQAKHPLGQGILTAMAEHQLAPLPIQDLTQHPGQGLSAQLAGQSLRVGSEAFLTGHGLVVDRSSLGLDAPAPELSAASWVWVAWGPRVLGAVALADGLKPEAGEAIQALKGDGLQVLMLTGDRPEVAAAVAQALGGLAWQAGLSPQAKLEEIRRRQALGEKVAMVGDGVNDAPALAAADLGVALGTGADVALAASDLSLVSGDPRGVAVALQLARATQRTVRGNLAWAFAYNLAALPLAVAGQLTPMIAGGAMALSSVFVVLHSLRLRAWRPRLG